MASTAPQQSGRGNAGCQVTRMMVLNVALRCKDGDARLTCGMNHGNTAYLV